MTDKKKPAESLELEQAFAILGNLPATPAATSGDAPTDWQWCYENPTLAAAEIDSLRARIERAAPATASGDELPPLPEPHTREQTCMGWRDYFVADQMQDYARAAVSAATKPTAEQKPVAWAVVEDGKFVHVSRFKSEVEEWLPYRLERELVELFDHPAATKPAPIDMSELRKLAWTRTGMDENSASTEYFYRAADVQSLLATRPAAPTVPEDWSDTLNEVADLLMERNWRGDLAETLRDFAKCAAPAATPAAQDQAEQSHVMPPCAAPAGQQDAAIRLLLGALARCRFDESAEGRARIANEALEALAELYKSAASRCRAQGGNTQAEPVGHVIDYDRVAGESIIDAALEPGTAVYLAHPAASADAVVEALEQAEKLCAMEYASIGQPDDPHPEAVIRNEVVHYCIEAIRQVKSGVLRTGEGAGNAN